MRWENSCFSIALMQTDVFHPRGQRNDTSAENMNVISSIPKGLYVSRKYERYVASHPPSGGWHVGRKYERYLVHSSVIVCSRKYERYVAFHPRGMACW